MQSEVAPGVRNAGKQTAGRIVKAAREFLTEAGYAQFSMRNVAARAKLRLSNLQYYFPTRDDLVRALFVDADIRYREEYAKVLATAPQDRRKRFEAVLDFNLRDVARSDTRRFFIQLWALLSSLDKDSGNLLRNLYQIDLQHLSEHIAELVPGLDPPEVRRRATLLAALIEGLMVVRGAHSPHAAEMKRLTTAAKELGLQIAYGSTG